LTLPSRLLPAITPPFSRDEPATEELAAMIRRLAYVSRPRPDLPPTEISRIVVKSRINNEGEGLTGVLVYTGADFAQLIEGRSDRVEALWKRINQDDRHQDIALLFDKTARIPWFPDWRMGYLANRDLARRIAEWRKLQGAIDERSRAELRRLLAAADSL
jgi:hypothetical protein